LLVSLAAAAGQPVWAQTAHLPHAREELIGAWRLVSIQLIGPNGRTDDPFYNAAPTGALFYDASGWMSVQIAGQPRPAMQAPASRPAGPHGAASAEREARVLDTYYAYVATWEYDPAASTVTHHIKTSLIPGEDGMSYTQTVTLEGDRLIFTVRRDKPGGVVVQEKVWQRIPSSVAER
jgi:hypothetical protein